MLIRVFSSIGYALLYASLTLFLVKNLHINEEYSFAIVGLFLMLHYSLAIISGMIVGVIVDYIDALIIGILLQVIAIYPIFNYQLDSFVWISIFLVGCMCSSIPINMIITNWYQQNHLIRDNIFSINYIALNIGNIFGFTLAGYIQTVNNFRFSSYLASTFMIVAFILCCIYRKNFKNTQYCSKIFRYKLISFIKLTLIIIISIYTVLLIFKYCTSNNLMLCLFAITITLFVLITYNVKNYNKNSLIFTFLSIAYLLFWSLYFLMPTCLTLFVHYNTDSTLFGINIPVAWLSTLNSIMIIFLLPIFNVVFNHSGKAHNYIIVNRFIIGLMFMICAFATLSMGIIISGFNVVNLKWVVVSYIFLTCSELFIAPLMFSIVSTYINADRQNVMMGLLMSIMGISGIFSSKISSFVSLGENNLYYSNIGLLTMFVILSILTFIFIGGLFLLKKL